MRAAILLVTASAFCTSSSTLAAAALGSGLCGYESELSTWCSECPGISTCFCIGEGGVACPSLEIYCFYYPVLIETESDNDLIEYDELPCYFARGCRSQFGGLCSASNPCERFGLTDYYTAQIAVKRETGCPY